MAGVFSYLLPGSGHRYIEEPKRGRTHTILFAGSVLTIIVGGIQSALSESDGPSPIAKSGLLVLVGNSLYAITDSVLRAGSKNREDRRNSTEMEGILMIQPTYFLIGDRANAGLQLTWKI